MLYGFASGTVACEAALSSRSLPLGTFREETRDTPAKRSQAARAKRDGCIRRLRDHVILTILE